MSVGKSSISRISKKDVEPTPAPEEVKVEAAAEVAPAPKAPAKKSAPKTAPPKTAAKKAPAKVAATKPAAPKAAKPASPKKAEVSGFKIYQVTDELPYYLL